MRALLKKWSKRLFKWGLALVILLILLVGLTFLGLTQTQSGRSLVEREVLTLLNDSVFASELGAGRLEAIWPKLVLSDATIVDQDGFPMGAVERLEVDYRLLPLLRQHAQLDRVLVTGAAVRLRIRDDGSLNLSGLMQESEPTPQKTGPGWTVALDVIELRDSVLSLRDARNDDARLVVLSSLEADLSLGVEDGVEIEVTRLASLFGHPLDLEAEVPLSLDDVTLALGAGTIEFGTARIRFGETTFADIRGSLESSEGSATPFERIEVQIPTIDLQPEDVAPFLGGTELLAPLEIAASIAGPVDEVLVDLPIHGPAGTIELSLTFDLSDPATPSYSGLARVVRFRPAEWLNIELDADVSTAIYLDGQNFTPQDATVSARVEVGPSQILGYPVELAYFSASYADGRLTFPRLNLASMGSSVIGGAWVDLEGNVDIDVDVDAPDLSQLGSVLPDQLADMTGSVLLDVDVEGVLPLDELQSGGKPTPENLLEWAGAIGGNGSLTVRDFALGDIAAGVVDLEFAATATNGMPDLVVGLDASAVSVAGTTIDLVELQGAFDGEKVEAQGDVRMSSIGVSARYDLDGRLDGDQLTVNVRSLAARVAEMNIELLEEARVVASLDENMSPLTVSLSPVNVRALDVSLLVDAWFRLEDQAVTATVIAPVVALAPLADRFAPEIDVEGWADVRRLHLTGTLSSPQVDLDARVRQLEVLGLAPYDVEVDLNYDARAVRGRVGVSARQVEVAWVELGSHGFPMRVDLSTGEFAISGGRPMDVVAHVERLKFGELTALLPEGVELATRGYVALELIADGTPDAPNAEATLLLNDATFEIPVGEEDWRVTDANLNLDVTHESVGGRSIVALEVLGALGGRDILDARLNSSVDLDEFLESPTDALSELVLQADGQLRGLTVADAPPSIVESAGLESGLLEADFRWDGNIDSGAGRAELVAIDVTMEGKPPVSMHVLASTDTRTAIDAAVWLGSDGISPMVEGPSGLRPSEGAEARAELDTRFYATLTGSIAGPAITLVDAEGLSAAQVALRLSVPDSPVTALSELVELPEEAHGRLAGYVDLFGTTNQPEAFGRIALRDVDLVGGAEGTVGAQIGYQGGRAELGLVVCDGEGEGVVADASVLVPLDLPSIQAGLPPVSTWPVRASVFADTDLGAVAPVLAVGSLVDALSGRLKIELEVDGLIGSPQVVGHAELSEAGIGFIPLARLFENVEVELQFSSDRIELASLRVDDERGTVRGSGAIALEAFEPRSFDFDIRSRDFLLLDMSGLTAFTTGSVGVSGSVNGPAIEAEVELSGVEVDADLGSGGAGPTRRAGWVYVVDEDVFPEQVGERNPTPIAEQAAAARNAPPLELSLSINTEDAGIVRHQFGHVEFEIDLDVEVGEELILDGIVALPAGINRVFGNTFEYRRGEIRFAADDAGIDPVIDVLVAHQLSSDVTEYLTEAVGPPQDDRATIQIPVVGRLSELAAEGWKVSLRSDPQMSESDTLSVLVQGRLGSDTDAEAQQGTQALAQLALGFLGDQFSGGAIDTLSIESTGESARIEGGKYIADNLYVSGTYIRSPDDNDDNNFEVSLEWILRRIGAGSLRLELRGGDQAKGGLELLYNLRRMARERPDAQ